MRNRMAASGFFLSWTFGFFVGATVTLVIFAFLADGIRVAYTSFYKDHKNVFELVFQRDFFAALSGHSQTSEENKNQAMVLGTLIGSIPPSELEDDLRIIVLLSQTEKSDDREAKAASELRKLHYLSLPTPINREAKIQRINHYKRAAEIVEWRQMMQISEAVDAIRSVYRGGDPPHIEVGPIPEWKLFGIFSGEPLWKNLWTIAIFVVQAVVFTLYSISARFSKCHPLFDLPRGILPKLSLLVVVPGALPIMLAMIFVPGIRWLGEAKGKMYFPRGQKQVDHFSFQLPSTSTKEALNRLKRR